MLRAGTGCPIAHVAGRERERDAPAAGGELKASAGRGSPQPASMDPETGVGSIGRSVGHVQDLRSILRPRNAISRRKAHLPRAEAAGMRASGAAGCHPRGGRGATPWGIRRRVTTFTRKKPRWIAPGAAEDRSRPVGAGLGHLFVGLARPDHPVPRVRTPPRAAGGQGAGGRTRRAASVPGLAGGDRRPRRGPPTLKREGGLTAPTPSSPPVSPSKPRGTRRNCAAEGGR